jgi:hypothetical protein
MTRTEALEAFFAAVDAYMPHDALIGRAAIRDAGISYAHAAVEEVLARWTRSVDDDRHLLDGVTASPPPPTEGLRLVSRNDDAPLFDDDGTGGLGTMKPISSPANASTVRSGTRVLSRTLIPDQHQLKIARATLKNERDPGATRIMGRNGSRASARRNPPPDRQASKGTAR